MTMSGDSCGVEAPTSKLSRAIRLISLHFGSQRYGPKSATRTVSGSLAIEKERREAAMRKVMLAASFGAFSSVKPISIQFFLVAPSSVAVQNEGHSTVILPIKERTLCAPQKS